MPLLRNILWLTLAAWLAVGCATTKVEPVAVTEVALPESKPFAVSSQTVDTNALLAVPPSAVARPPTPTNPPSPNLQSAIRNLQSPVAPSTAWVPLANWCVANNLGQPQKIGANQFAAATRGGALVVQAGSQVARWEGTQLWLGYAPRVSKGQALLHWLDIQKTLDPLLHRSAPAPKPGRVLVLDAGHGGADSGTHGTARQLEKHFTLDWALRAEPLLRSNGWTVFLTRTVDQDVPLTNRLALADRVGADLFLSLHFNGLAAQARHSGIETFCLTPAGMPSSVTRGYEDDPRQEFPNNAYDRENLQVAFRLHREVLTATRAADGAVRRARFMGVLRGQRRPAVLIEGGFLSNPEEARRISTAAYRQKLAEALARALP
ncbi:MAG: N-acetylmuramoyl-L-alanine amidase [Verrucomicrobia bacterium]|nr:N-acetylmuramoyl-L-alanine amidase [Verrucomicrobiota bacterium]